MPSDNETRYRDALFSILDEYRGIDRENLLQGEKNVVRTAARVLLSDPTPLTEDHSLIIQFAEEVRDLPVGRGALDDYVAKF